MFARDTTTSEVDKRAMLDALSSVSLLAVVQSDITHLGAFNFYSKADVEKRMLISYTDDLGKTQMLSPIQAIDPDLAMLLNTIRPILGAALGNMGNNFHFYVLSDESKTARRIIDPYQAGDLRIQLSSKTGVRMTAGIEMPLDSLYIPRKCPNGRDAHISWNFCPWTGERLED